MTTNDAIARVIKEYWQAELPDLRPRPLPPDIENALISDVIGPRRAGKTYLMFLYISKLIEKGQKESTIYINFENRKLLPVKGDYFNDIIEFIHAEQLIDRFGKLFLFLDEVQHLEGWEKYARSIYDEFKGRMKIFVSGSSANLLSDEYSKLLTGRHITTRVLPLSFSEYLSFKGLGLAKGSPTEKEEARIKKQLKQYLAYGGFPEVVLGKSRDAMLSQLFNDMVARDVTSRTDVRSKDVIEEFANFLASNVSNLLSFGKMSRYFKSRGINVSTPTLITYFNHMKEVFLFFDNTIFSYNVRDRMQYPRKIYCVDNGLAHIASDSGENLGNLFENAVAVELLRRGKKVHYWKDKEGLEVDFIVREGEKIRPIQACYDIGAFDTKEREVKALVKCLDEFDVDEGLIITSDFEGEEEVKGKRIVFTPLWKFLLGRRSICSGLWEDMDEKDIEALEKSTRDLRRSAKLREAGS